MRTCPFDAEMLCPVAGWDAQQASRMATEEALWAFFWREGLDLAGTESVRSKIVSQISIKYGSNGNSSHGSIKLFLLGALSTLIESGQRMQVYSMRTL